MPGYSWRNNKTGKIYDIIRRHTEYEQHPERDETDLDEAAYAEAEWERVLQGAPTVVKPWHWSKGNWNKF